MDINTEISCSGSVILPLFDYGNAVIVAAEESGKSHCESHNNTMDLPFNDYGSGNKNITTSCTEEDAHVAQGVAFFLQNFFILLRLVKTCHIHVQTQNHNCIIYFIQYSYIQVWKNRRRSR